MRPLAELTADQIGYWAGFDMRQVEYQPPPGATNTRPVNTVVTATVEGNVVRVPWVMDHEELDQLRRGGTLWLSQWGGLCPHQLEVQPPLDDDAPAPAPSLGDLGRAIGQYTESEGGDGPETLQAHRGLFDIYDQWVAAGRPEH